MHLRQPWGISGKPSLKIFGHVKECRSYSWKMSRLSILIGKSWEILENSSYGKCFFFPHGWLTKVGHSTISRSSTSSYMPSSVNIAEFKSVCCCEDNSVNLISIWLKIVSIHGIYMVIFMLVAFRRAFLCLSPIYIPGK